MRFGWELDLFGRVRHGVQAQRAEADATAVDAIAVQVAVAADVAQAYFELRGRQAQLAAARGNAGNQQEALRLVETLRDAGRGTDFDTARASALLASTQARVPALEAEVAALVHRLAVLTGQTPGALVATLAPAQPLPVLDDPVSAGAPGDLLRRRRIPPAGRDRSCRRRHRRPVPALHAVGAAGHAGRVIRRPVRA